MATDGESPGGSAGPTAEAFQHIEHQMRLMSGRAAALAALLASLRQTANLDPDELKRLLRELLPEDEQEAINEAEAVIDDITKRASAITLAARINPRRNRYSRTSSRVPVRPPNKKLLMS